MNDYRWPGDNKTEAERIAMTQAQREREMIWKQTLDELRSHIEGLERQLASAKPELKEAGELLDEIAELRRAILAYLSEFDNPAPDPMYRKTLRDRLRKMVGAPDQPPPRSRK